MKEDKERHPFLSSLSVWPHKLQNFIDMGSSELKTHTLGNDVFITYLDEASEVTEEIWRKLTDRAVDSLLKIAKKEKTKMANLTDQEKKFVAAGGVIPSEVKKSNTSPGHYSLTLRHTHPHTWISADGRETRIESMVDQHMINTMRWLIRNATSLKEMYVKDTEALLKIAELQYDARLIGLIEHEIKYVTSLRNSVGYLELIVKPFTALAEEIVKRFGQRALRSLYDGE